MTILDKMNLFEIIISGALFSYTGATVRWIYSSISRTIFNKPKFTYSEYVYGPKNSTDYYDIHGHEFNNYLIGFITVMGTLILLLT